MRIVRWIKPELYKWIKEVMPILCVDAIVHRGREFLLLQRNNEPAKDLWWTAGGRLYKGEKLLDGIMRKVKEETGLDIIVERLIGVYDQYWDTSPDGVAIHTPDVFYLVRPVGKSFDIKLDSQHRAWEWMDSVDGLHSYIAQPVIDSGILEG